MARPGLKVSGGELLSCEGECLSEGREEVNWRQTGDFLEQEESAKGGEMASLSHP